LLAVSDPFVFAPQPLSPSSLALPAMHDEEGGLVRWRHQAASDAHMI
jgi:hypothetical protein